ncbi:MAG: DUF2523 domain-containing protein [Herminiimonas sp.]|uniref:DUF2523 domain-containing protein n=1 Tax=Herminiimonas sp. TaxID=1926289 RepID=UPI00271E3587|nr:DUF2523 domain-containing protein [Herminiimonas sp.]MDO9421060.1 DUF2523 domain-containing protein [Herminiimonas sp.]
MSIAVWLVSLVGPLVIRGIIALGFTAVTLTGLTAATNALVQSAQQSWSTLPLVVMQLASLSGVPESLGLVMGSYVARIAIFASLGASKYVFKK